MEFIQALKKVYEDPISDDEFDNPIKLYSHIQDLIGDTRVNKKLVSSFYEVEKRIGLFRQMSEKKYDNLESFYDLYSSVHDLLDKTTFIELVNDIAKAIGIAEDRTDSSVSQGVGKATNDSKLLPLQKDNSTQDATWLGHAYSVPSKEIASRFDNRTKERKETNIKSLPSPQYINLTTGTSTLCHQDTSTIRTTIKNSCDNTSSLTTNDYQKENYVDEDSNLSSSSQNENSEPYHTSNNYSDSYDNIDSYDNYVSFRKHWNPVWVVLFFVFLVGSILTMTIGGVIKLPWNVYGWFVGIGTLILIVEAAIVFTRYNLWTAALATGSFLLILGSYIAIATGGALQLSWDIYGWFVGIGIVILLIVSVFMYGVLGIVGIVCSVCLLGATIGMIIGRAVDMSWNTYQWFAGVGAVIVLLVDGIMIIAASEEVRKPIIYTIILGALAITNLCLFILLNSSYNILCWWVSIPLMLLHIFGLIVSFKFEGIRYGWINVGLGCLTLVTFILNIVL